MNQQQLRALALRDTDVQGALRRLGNNERLYISLLTSFLDDPTMSELNQAIQRKSWDAAFTAAHALKGLAGNLGFVQLMHATGQLVVLIRSGRVSEVGECMERVDGSYRDITCTIRNNFYVHRAGEPAPFAL